MLTDKQLNRAIYSIWDFQQALSALTFILEEFDFEGEYNVVELRRYRSYEANLIISMARPLEPTRSGSTISFKALGIKLDEKQKALCARVLDLRRKLIAHSDEDEMHFRVDIHTSSLDGKHDDFKWPIFKFMEWLHLSEAELMELETFLRWLTSRLSEFFVKLAKEEPERLQKYKIPTSLMERGAS
ncbi:hypothetical protein D210916BOD24_30860 [Alteromonas sp. D210916BOD_24]|uniref:hypothetical protein n=1 Tax=Alteromonas sp. D210916BOD_24 TaxID=3157618 RepID=UPI00399CBA07